jgi:glutamyl-tRNA(Gln) amidotransferase subunit D
MNHKLGDKISLILKSNEEIKGTFVPSTDETYVVLKLDSGYNQPILKENIKSLKVTESHAEHKKKVDEIKQDESLPLIYLLHIGGTIASKVDYKTGGVSAQINPAELLYAVPELKVISRIKTKILFNVLSENIRFQHYNRIAEEIIDILDKDNVAGIIISHGTDTLHYATAGLSFILQSIKVPVVLVGAQRSSDRPSTDSAINLICASKFIVDQIGRQNSLTGIFASMHSTTNDDQCNIYNGLNLKKLHSSRRDAFKQINSYPVAIVKKAKIEYSTIKNIKEEHPLFEPAFFRKDIKVGILKSHPNLFAKEILNYKGFDGLIIEGTGLGHLPIEEVDKYSSENKAVYNALLEMSVELPIVMTTQCVSGSTNLNVYSGGRKIKKLAILESGAMISETAFIKLAWLLSNFSHEEIKELWGRNFVGEVISKNIFEKE